MSQPDRRTGSGRMRRLLARVAVVAGATVAGTSAACLIGCGLSMADENAGGVLGPVQDRVVEVAGTVEPVLGQADEGIPAVVDEVPAVVDEVPAVVEDVTPPAVELPSAPLPDVEPVLDVPLPETLPEPDVPAPERPDTAPAEPAPADTSQRGPEVPGQAAPAPPAVSSVVVPTPMTTVADAPADRAVLAAPGPSIEDDADPAPPLPPLLGTAPAPPATGSVGDWPGTPSADRTSGLRTAPAPDAGTTTALRTAAQHVPGAPRPQPGTTPD
ncbi:hypothetical protein GIY23_22350 [Allosaccharopolyspora coralli]|uniref:Uncharacterized protein n=1 Tax=Allosaccharopolyspora coralli TaxID=2665642 RepID=A0A5Q3QER4_9PSEU|nr:hypothetical protein [Allosaccharopolyspora coralli]QGK71876.1 hypothetical protein GIY23_22350 [Allosaccharopolyspora coralli]